jgi:integrase
MHTINNNIINGIENFKDIKLEFDDDENAYGSFTVQQINELIEFAGEQHWKPMTQKLFFKLAFVTGIRKQAIKDLTWGQVRYLLDSKAGQYFWCICVIDKGKKINQAIDIELYNKLTLLKDAWTNEEDLVFDIDIKTLEKTLKEYCQHKGIDQKKERLCMHSIRKASGDACLALTGGDIMEASKHLNDRPETAMKKYLKRNIQAQ